MRINRPLAVTAAAFCGALALGAGPAVAATAAPQAAPAAVADDPPPPPGTGDPDPGDDDGGDDLSIPALDSVDQYLDGLDAGLDQYIAGALAS